MSSRHKKAREKRNSMPDEKYIFLYVEDNPNDVAIVRRTFQKEGSGELQVVSDGQEAIDYLCGHGVYADRKNYPIPHVILLDLKMPRVDGFGFLRWLHDTAPEHVKRLPVIAMSTYALPQDVKRACDMGANCYLTKPIDWDQFQEEMELLGISWGDHAGKPRV
jgi:two-component system response regulator